MNNTDPSNYRGITLLSCLGKAFTTIVNNSLTSVVDIPCNQAGFRKKHSVIDHIFSLKNLADVYINNNKKIYCAFIKYCKAFDTVWRKGLWYKLLKKEIIGKILDIVYNMYQNIKSCVASEGKLSALFVSNVGVQQGENLSPLLFSIYVDDLENYLSANGSVPLKVDKMFNTENVLKLLVLLYADDTLILADSPKNLQKPLHNLSLYCIVKSGI